MSKSKPLPKQASPARPPGKGKGAPPADTMPPEQAKAYWRKNLTIIAILLSIWTIVSYGIVILDANFFFSIPVGRIPMSFWFAQQGVIVVGVTFAIYIWIGYQNRQRDNKGFYVAGQRVPAIVSGAATAADWMSEATFISMADLISTMGYDGFACWPPLPPSSSPSPTWRVKCAAQASSLAASLAFPSSGV